MADVGRPTVMTPEVIRKLEEVFAIGGTDLEACFWADISKTALYEYQEAHPEFKERKAKLKEKIVLAARQTVAKSIASDVNSAWRMLERKDPELNPKSQVDHTTKGDKIGDNEAIRALTEKLNQMHKSAPTTPDGVHPEAS